MRRRLIANRQERLSPCLCVSVSRRALRGARPQALKSGRRFVLADACDNMRRTMNWAGLIGNSQSSLASSAARARALTHTHGQLLKGHGIMDTVIWLADAKGQLVLNF